jgi:hypothetical protein
VPSSASTASSVGKFCHMSRMTIVTPPSGPADVKPATRARLRLIGSDERLPRLLAPRGVAEVAVLPQPGAAAAGQGDRPILPARGHSAARVNASGSSKPHPPHERLRGSGVQELHALLDARATAPA